MERLGGQDERNFLQVEPNGIVHSIRQEHPCELLLIRIVPGKPYYVYLMLF